MWLLVATTYIISCRPSDAASLGRVISDNVISYWEDGWLFRLMLNLMGYASIILPGSLLIYTLKRSKYINAPEPNCFQRCLKLCVAGSEVEKPSLELGGETTRSPLPTAKSEQSMLHQLFILLFCFIGLQLSYLTWGILQEKIMTRHYFNAEGEPAKFVDSQFLVFVNRILAFLFAGTYILLTKQPPHTMPLYKYSYCSFSNIMSSWCQYEALKYVSFPTQVLSKACKIIPVMLMGKVVSKKSYELYEYITAATISAGMSVFLLSSKDATGRNTVTTISGIIILCGYMLFDSFTSNWQGKLFSQYHMSSVQMMCGVNLFSVLLTSVSLVQQGGFYSSLSFMLNYSGFFLDCVLLSICSATGQLFIFLTIARFGPVVFVIMMTLRQAIAILLSCIIYHHALGMAGIIGVITVFASVLLRLYYSRKYALANKNKSLKVANGR